MKSVMVHNFQQTPSADIPRSSFNLSHGYKTTFDAGLLIPVFCQEALPGDTFTVNPTLFARLNTPIYPLMDNIFLDIHFFSVPLRQIWQNFRKFCGEQANPGDSTDYSVPITVAPAATGYLNQSVQDYLGLPTYVTNYEHSALPMRAYRHIYNEWYRDQNLINSVGLATGDGPDVIGSIAPYRRGKRADYFTSCLPWLQKGDSVLLPLGEKAFVTHDLGGANLNVTVKAPNIGPANYYLQSDGTYVESDTTASVISISERQLYADLSGATAATVNQLRQAFQIQKLLERDARSGTRYAEIVRSHFGVDFLDVTYRPEFLGGTSTPVSINAVPQTSETGGTPQGGLAAYGVVTSRGGGFTKSFTEHCLVLGIVSVRADLTYQQGLNRMFTRQTRYDFYWPALAHIGEQAVPNIELYCQDPSVDTGATGTPDNERIFGYQERWAEYRYKQSLITGKLRSNDPVSLDAWHLSQEFGSLPQLNQSFIQEDPPFDRVVAIPSEPDFVMDCYFNFQAARPMPLYSVPGLIDHF